MFSPNSASGYLVSETVLSSRIQWQEDAVDRGELQYHVGRGIAHEHVISCLLLRRNDVPKFSKRVAS